MPGTRGFFRAITINVKNIKIQKITILPKLDLNSLISSETPKLFPLFLSYNFKYNTGKEYINILKRSNKIKNKFLIQQINK